ncbi:hypothetical protein L873DRAFT_1796351 [Choiromyces venosus 120613-1]|uniref:Uncharacterized protein n=1 Tax=Choiromyces venosus 120613-1 TaxID=1336337 RepID=A0A3N4J583_9PEZI|nr:hypothetical protein L873DRAFT_1796351 [Choiromyces venosus 120613-1]
MSSSAPAENAHESQIDVVIATPEIEGEGGPSKEREKRTSKHDNRGSTSKEDMEKPLPKEPKKESSRSQGKESANASTGSEESRSKKKSKQRAREEPSDVVSGSISI